MPLRKIVLAAIIIASVILVVVLGAASSVIGSINTTPTPWAPPDSVILSTLTPQPSPTPGWWDDISTPTAKP